MKTPLRFKLPRRFLASLLVGVAVVAGVAPGRLAAAGAGEGAAYPTKKVLYFSKMSVAPTSHPVALRKDGQPSLSETVLADLGRRHGIEFTFSKDGSLFSDAYVAQFDAIVFYTLGDLTQLGLDREPPMTAAGKAALLRAIEQGKGFVGLHGADNTFLSPRRLTHGPARYTNDPDPTDPYLKMVGGEFIMHNRQQPGRMIVTDPKFPGAPAADFTLHEEWYSHRTFAPDIHVILVQDTRGMEGNLYQRPPYPSTWARLQGRGRVFYTSMGHREDVWTNPLFQKLLMGGLDWALRRVDADLTPNLQQVTSEAHVLPPYVEPSPAAGAKAAPAGK
ncbi:MAG: ThuA domain-containing protein [Verrucomicrobia bacterium]|nr:ThuA domain-containing protein [Verrucomicrobiota bacterium]